MKKQFAFKKTVCGAAPKLYRLAIDGSQAEDMAGDSVFHRFDLVNYLLQRYGCRMNKREVIFEAHKSRATLDNMRNPAHRNYCAALVDAEIKNDEGTKSGVPVLFHTHAIGVWLNGQANS